MTPTYANSAVGAVATATNWAMSKQSCKSSPICLAFYPDNLFFVDFLIGQIFPVIFAAIQGYSFVIFATICFCAFLFTFFFLPESKNRSIENIVRGFERNEPAWRRPKRDRLHLDQHADSGAGDVQVNKDATPDASHPAPPADDAMKAAEAEPTPPWQHDAIRSNTDEV